MLRISKKADYAVFLLGAIARQGAYPGGAAGDSVLSAHEIAKQAGLNKSVVANLLKEFARKGLLESVRGLRGGYRLVREPADVSLAEILAVVEGPFTLVDCVEPAPVEPAQKGENRSALLPIANDNQECCSLIGFCPSKDPMRVVHRRIVKLFEEIHLDELCNLRRAPQPTTHRTAAATPR